MAEAADSGHKHGNPERKEIHLRGIGGRNSPVADKIENEARDGQHKERNEGSPTDQAEDENFHRGEAQDLLAFRIIKVGDVCAEHKPRNGKGRPNCVARKMRY